MAESVTMSGSHYEALTKKAGEFRKGGLYGEYGLTIAKRNQVGLATIVVAAVAGYFLTNKKLTDKIPGMSSYWWVKGAAIIAIGWYLWRKQNKYATVALAIGAAILATSFRAQQKSPDYEAGDAGDGEWDAAGCWVPAAGTMGGEVPASRGGTDQSERLAQSVFGKARAA